MNQVLEKRTVVSCLGLSFPFMTAMINNFAAAEMFVQKSVFSCVGLELSPTHENLLNDGCYQYQC